MLEDFRRGELQRVYFDTFPEEEMLPGVPAPRRDLQRLAGELLKRRIVDRQDLLRAIRRRRLRLYPGQEITLSVHSTSVELYRFHISRGAWMPSKSSPRASVSRATRQRNRREARMASVSAVSTGQLS